MFLTLWYYLQGYVIVEVSGFAIERFINLVAHNGIYLWDLQSKDQKIHFKTSIKDFKKLKPYAKKSRCRMKIATKKGLPFTVHRYKRRKMLIIGFFVFMTMLWGLSSFVWLVEVEGAKRISSIDIITSLEEQGYGVGKFKGQLDLRAAEAYLVTAYPDIIWTGIKFEGTRLLVQVAETVPAPEMTNIEGMPSNIIAKRDALITYIAVDKGMPQVKKGDIVKKGDVLIAGQMPLGVDDPNFYYVASKAKIKGKTVYTSSNEIKMRQIKKDYTNEISKKYTFKLFNKAIVLKNQKIPFNYYDRQITLNQLSITRLFPLPFAFEVETRVAYIPSYKELSEEEAKDELLSKLWEDISKSLSQDAIILKREAFFQKTGNAITGTLHVVAEEDIGYTVKVPDHVVPSNEGENTQ